MLAGVGRGGVAGPPSVPDGHLEPERYYAYLLTHVLPHAINASSPHCMAHMTTIVPEFVHELSHVLLALNQNLVKREASNSFSTLERETLAMMHRLTFDESEAFYGEHADNSENSLGMFCSGGTLANLTALWIARNAKLGGVDKSVESQGAAAALQRSGYAGAAIVGSALMHYSVRKAAGLLGIGEQNVRDVPVNERGRIRGVGCRQVLRQCVDSGFALIALVGVAGTTDCGSIDDLEELADLAEEFGVHYHVDAAWGGALLFSQTHRVRLRGITRADSVTIDAHKQMCLPVGISMLLLRNTRAALAIEKTSNYMLQAGSGDLGRCAVEGSRPGNSLFVHAALNIIGRRGYESLVDESMRRAKFMADQLRRSSEFELLVEPDTNIVLYRYIPSHERGHVAGGGRTAAEQATINAFNESIQRTQFEAGRTLVSRTTLQHPGCAERIVALRAVILSPLVTDDDVLALLADQLAIARGLERR